MLGSSVGRRHSKAASVAHQRATTALAKAVTALKQARTEKEGIGSRFAEADAAILRIDDRMIEGKEEPGDDGARLKNEHLKLRLSRLLEKAQAEVAAAQRAVDAAVATRQRAYNDLMTAEEEERYAGATEQAVALEAILIERLRLIEIIEKGGRVRTNRPYIGGHEFRQILFGRKERYKVLAEELDPRSLRHQNLRRAG